MEALVNPVTELKKPLKIGPLTFKNRFGMPAMSRNRSNNNTATSLNGEYFYQRALGGCGFITAGGITISDHGDWMREIPQMSTPEHAAAWKKVTDRVHSVPGAIIFAQIWHLGRLIKFSPRDASRRAWAPSAVYPRHGKASDDGIYDLIPEEEGFGPEVEAIKDPKEFVQMFKRSAQLMKEAGFDGVELHSGNGYLLAQFLDDKANQRTDEYGGSVENRARFVLEIIDALIEVWGSYRVGIKLTPAMGRGDVGMFPVDKQIEQFTYLIKELDKRPLCYILLVRYTDWMDVKMEDGKLRGPVHPVWASYRHLIKNAKVFLNGSIDVAEAEQLLLDGTGDLIVSGRSWLVNPDYANRILEGVKPVSTFDFTHFARYPKCRPDMGYTDWPFATIDYKPPPELVSSSG